MRISPIRDIDVTVITVCSLTNISGITPSHVIGRSRGHKASVLRQLVRRKRIDNENNSPRFDIGQGIKIASVRQDKHCLWIHYYCYYYYYYYSSSSSNNNNNNNIITLKTFHFRSVDSAKCVFAGHSRLQHRLCFAPLMTIYF